MFQKPSLGFITTTVQSEVMYGSNLEESQAVLLLSKFDLLQYRYKSPFELSGGEQRRLSLALTMIHNNDLVVFDEPTAGLDAKQVNFLQMVLGEFKGTAIFITHDQRIIGKFIKELIVLDNGFIRFHGTITDIDRTILRYLGIPSINPTVALAIRYLERRIPMSPEQLEVCHANSV